MSNLATVSVDSRLSNESGRALVTSRGHHFIVDSPPPLGGPNEEVNPLDILLAALATCGTFVCETAARELDIPLESALVTVEGDFDPRGVKGVEGVDPRLQAFRVMLSLQGPSAEQGQTLADAFRARCPVFTTLNRSCPVEITVEV